MLRRLMAMAFEVLHLKLCVGGALLLQCRLFFWFNYIGAFHVTTKKQLINTWILI